MQYAHLCENDKRALLSILTLCVGTRSSRPGCLDLLTNDLDHDSDGMHT